MGCAIFGSGHLVFGALRWVLLTAYGRGGQYDNGSWYAHCFLATGGGKAIVFSTRAAF